MKYKFKDNKYKSMIYTCYFIQNPKKKYCTPKEMESFINRYKGIK